MKRKKSGRKDGKKAGKEVKQKAIPAQPAAEPSFSPRWALAIGLVLAFVGANLQLLTHIQAARWFGLGLLVVGMAMAVYFAMRMEKTRGEMEAEDVKSEAKARRKVREWRRKDLAAKFMRRVTLNGRLLPWFPAVGIAAIVIDLTWNLAIAHSLVFLSQDWTMWMLGIVFIVYNFVPATYGRERDFALIFVTVYAITMVLPMGLYRLVSGTTDLPGGFVFALLGSPTSFFVNLTGAVSSAHGAAISFRMFNGDTGELYISTGCAGLDSLFLFISGFVAFLLVENVRLDRRISVALVAGIATAYLANILRMTIIVLMGVHYGTAAMLATHENAGTLIFLGWIAVFWFAMYHFVIRREKSQDGDGDAEGGKAGKAKTKGTGDAGSDDGLFCEECGVEIDPGDVPDKCPKCGNRFEKGLFCEECGTKVDPDDVPGKCPKCGNKFD